MTLPISYSWFPQGERLYIPYEAPQGRRVNVIGAYFSHGPMAGEFQYQCYASLPTSAAKKQRKTPEQQAGAYGLTPAEVGPIDASRFLEFVWQVAGRPVACPPVATRTELLDPWKRERPLVIVLDNYSVHHSQSVQEALPALEAADVFLFYLPSYSPELSRIEPVWHDVKHHYLVERSFEEVCELKRAVEQALSRKATDLKNAAANLSHNTVPESTNFLRRAA